MLSKTRSVILKGIGPIQNIQYKLDLRYSIIVEINNYWSKATNCILMLIVRTLKYEFIFIYMNNFNNLSYLLFPSQESDKNGLYYV